MRRSVFSLWLIFLLPVLTLADQKRCEDLIDLKLPETTITLAETVAAGDFTAPDGQTYTVPAFCRVRGAGRPSADSNINTEVWLPLDNWNGRYYQVGNGGFAGRFAYPDLAGFLRRGNAVAATDTGHTGSSYLDSRWAPNQPEKIIDWGYRSLKVTADIAKAVVQTLYGKSPENRYFAGCSTGGRQALMLAQRYPQDWDGILAGAPSSYQQFLAFAWNQLMLRGDPESIIPPTKLAAIQRAALAACTPQAQVVDGIAADPRHCRFDPAVLICEGEETADCLTAKQVTSLRHIYAGPRLTTGEQVYPGFEPTLESYAGSWTPWLVTDKAGEAFQFQFANGLFADMVVNDPDWDFRTFNLDQAFEQVKNKDIAGEPFALVMNDSDPDLSAFKQQGGKLLMYFGWGDAAVAPQAGIDYYEDIRRDMGGHENTQDFFRLFMVPGMLHCAGGPGANTFGQHSNTPGLKDDPSHNITRALETWVELGIAPDRLIATKYLDDKPEQGVVMTRPLCPYPQLPVLQGEGSNKEAANFACVTEETQGGARNDQ